LELLAELSERPLQGRRGEHGYRAGLRGRTAGARGRRGRATRAGSRTRGTAARAARDGDGRQRDCGESETAHVNSLVASSRARSAGPGNSTETLAAARP